MLHAPVAILQFVSGMSSGRPTYSYYCTQIKTHPTDGLKCDEEPKKWCEHSSGPNYKGYITPKDGDYDYWCRTGMEVTSPFISCNGVAGTADGAAKTSTTSTGVPKLHTALISSPPAVASTAPHWVSRGTVTFTQPGPLGIAWSKGIVTDASQGKPGSECAIIKLLRPGGAAHRVAKQSGLVPGLVLASVDSTSCCDLSFDKQITAIRDGVRPTTLQFRPETIIDPTTHRTVSVLPNSR